MISKPTIHRDPDLARCLPRPPLRPRQPQRPSTAARPPLSRLIDAIDQAVHSGMNGDERASAVADVLRESLYHPRLLPAEHRRSDAHTYRTNVVHTSPDGSFSLVALVWRPGQSTPVHSHLSWCVVGVYEGEEIETTYERVGHGRDRVVVGVGTQRFGPGDVGSLTSVSDIHRVHNGGDGLAISLHVYGLDYRRHAGSILERFDEPGEAGGGGFQAPTDTAAPVRQRAGLPGLGVEAVVLGPLEQARLRR